MPHNDAPYLRATDRPVTEKTLWGFDTEDDSKGTLKQISFTDGQTFQHFKKRDTALRWLFANFSDQGRKAVYMTATNLEYDLLNLFGDRLHLLDIRVKSAGATIVSARLSGTNVYFYDSLNHTRAGVRSLGEKLGLPKLKMDLTGWEYVDRDALITQRWCSGLQSGYAALGANFNATLPSSALDLYRRSFVPFPVRQPDPTTLKLLFSGYYGGRTEVFDLTPCRGRIHYIDVNSMYPAVMRGVYPNPNEYELTTRPDWKAFGVAQISIYIPRDLYFGPLPCRAGKLLFPVGRLRGTWTYPEIRAALDRGARIESVHVALEFPSTCEPFRRYVDFLYPKKAAATDPLERESVKLLLNSLYGKFGERVELVSLVPIDKVPADTAALVYGYMAWVPKGEKIPAHTNVVWASYTTAYARLRLLESLEAIRALGGRVLYCDTDSIIYEASAPVHSESDRLGEWKLEGQFSFAHFLGPKLYSLEGDGKRKVRAKGVPQDYAPTFFDTGTATFKRPYRLKTALRYGKNGTFWAEFTKRRIGTYDKRKVVDSGDTVPVELRMF